MNEKQNKTRKKKIGNRNKNVVDENKRLFSQMLHIHENM